MSIDIITAFLAGFAIGEVVTVLWWMGTLREDEDEETEAEAGEFFEGSSEGGFGQRGIESVGMDKGFRNDGGLYCDQEGDRWEKAGGSNNVPVVGGCNDH